MAMTILVAGCFYHPDQTGKKSSLDIYLPSSETERYGMTNGSCPLVFCLQKSCRGFEHSYHVAKALSGSVQFRTSVNGAQRRSLKKAALLKCLKDRNDMYGWVLGSHFGSLIDLEQEMVTYAQVRYTDLGDYVWVVCIYIYMVNKSGRRLCNSSR